MIRSGKMAAGEKGASVGFVEGDAEITDGGGGASPEAFTRRKTSFLINSSRDSIRLSARSAGCSAAKNAASTRAKAVSRRDDESKSKDGAVTRRESGGVVALLVGGFLDEEFFGLGWCTRILLVSL